MPRLLVGTTEGQVLSISMALNSAPVIIVYVYTFSRTLLSKTVTVKKNSINVTLLCIYPPACNAWKQVMSARGINMGLYLFTSTVRAGKYDKRVHGGGWRPAAVAALAVTSRALALHKSRPLPAARYLSVVARFGITCSPQQ